MTGTQLWHFSNGVHVETNVLTFVLTWLKFGRPFIVHLGPCVNCAFGGTNHARVTPARAVLRCVARSSMRLSALQLLRRHASTAAWHATQLDNRSILRLQGADVFTFLQARARVALHAASSARSCAPHRLLDFAPSGAHDQRRSRAARWERSVCTRLSACDHAVAPLLTFALTPVHLCLHSSGAVHRVSEHRRAHTV